MSHLAPVAVGAVAPVDLTAARFATVADAIAAAAELGRELPLPGSGRTATLWATLATIAAHDVAAARAIEPHLDAVVILDQSPTGTPAWATPTTTWGVFAAEGGDPLRLIEGDDGPLVDGVKPWCSLASRLDAALVTATRPDGERQLVAVELRHPGVATDDSAWRARGLSDVPSGPVTFDRVPAVEVGDPGWYLARPGFRWGALAVAACWIGGAVGVARAVREAVRRRPERDLTAMHLGAIDEDIATSLVLLADAARRVDAGADGAEARLPAKRVRAAVARSAEDVLIRAGHALGPAPFATDESFAKRTADLGIYLRQDHAEADLAALGRASAELSEW